jgi:hypothetical protein
MLVFESIYGVDLYTTCENFAAEGMTSPAGSQVEFMAFHPDAAKLKKDKAQVEQSQKGNQSFVRLKTGSGEDQKVNWLSCEKSEIDGDVKTKNSISGSISASAKNCSCDEDAPGAACEAYSNQLAKLAADCEGMKSLSGTFSNAGGLEKIKAKVKGDGEIFEE